MIDPCIESLRVSTRGFLNLLDHEKANAEYELGAVFCKTAQVGHVVRHRMRLQHFDRRQTVGFCFLKSCPDTVVKRSVAKAIRIGDHGHKGLALCHGHWSHKGEQAQHCN
jgi:hypothetical protein